MIASVVVVVPCIRVFVSKVLRVFILEVVGVVIRVVVTVVGFMVGSLIAGAVVVESVFSWPGAGRLLVTSVANRDLAVVQCLLLLVAFTMITANLIVDVLYGWIDPRLRVGRHSEAGA